MMPVRHTVAAAVGVAAAAALIAAATLTLNVAAAATDPPTPSAPTPTPAPAPAPVPEPNSVLTEQQIEQALHPPATTRGFTSRGLSRRDTAEHQQSVNLNVPFDLNSSTLSPQASQQLTQLEIALKSETLGKDRFLVAGHTDAKGSADYNKTLSQKRAEAVKRYLVSRGIEAGRLDAVGYGSEHLLAPDRPDDPANRRVEIRDLGGQAP
jgi:outer membrane protein OmpA-like peptidoglycan-associated protein